VGDLLLLVAVALGIYGFLDELLAWLPTLIAVIVAAAAFVLSIVGRGWGWFGVVLSLLAAAFVAVFALVGFDVALNAALKLVHHIGLRLHDIPLEQIPQPLVGAFADWGFDPFGGGWNFWQPQVDVREAMTAIKQPFGDQLNAYVVGESYSGVQGWVEGALTVAELVLQNHFGLSRPPWLPSDYYLGW
jgi:hypothetical protein